MIGVIAYWNPAKGFGFIYSDELKRRIFFHISQYRGPKPEADQVVEFDLAPGFHGHLEKQAVNVKLERAGVTALRAGVK